MRIRHARHLHEYVKKEIHVKMTIGKWEYSIKMGLRVKMQKSIVKITSNACNNQKFTSPMPKAWHQCVMVTVRIIP